jgi:hypothetical protein
MKELEHGMPGLELPKRNREIERIANQPVEIGSGKLVADETPGQLGGQSIERQRTPALEIVECESRPGGWKVQTAVGSEPGHEGLAERNV